MKTPSKTVEFLDFLKLQRGWSSDYRLAKELGWKQTTVSNYRCGRTAMSGPHALRIAHELEMPEAYVLACVEAERENAPDVARVWKALAETLRGVAGKAAAISLIAGGALLAGQKAPAAQAVTLTGDQSNTVTAVYIMRTMLGALIAWLLGPRTEFPALQVA